MMERMKKLVVYLLAVIKRLVLLPIARLKYGKRQIWLVCERSTDARDNGYHMFRYLRKEHPEIDVWYVITRDSVDVKKISNLGNIAYRGSLNHWMLYISAKLILTSFEAYLCSPSGSFRFSQDIIRKNRMKVVFLQHGVIAMDLPLYYQERSKFDLFICGAKPEFDYVSNNFHYTHGEVRYTGLARFDALHHFEVKRQILIMPTYRKWLQDLSEQEVSQSEYAETWNHLLRHPRLEEIAERYHVEVIFYPHQLMQKYVGVFSSSAPHVIIANNKHYDVQPLLKESALLVTDYSSVQFDFAYMKKPLLYYQFDEEKLYKSHNARSYFDFRRMGFGEQSTDEKELLDLITEYAANDFALKREYESRIDEFFPLYDTHNCERIYREIHQAFNLK